MRAFPGTFVVMTIVGADRASEVCFLLEIVRTFPSDLVGPRRSSQVHSEVAWHVPFARKGTHKIALTGMLRSDESVTLGGPPRGATSPILP